MLIFIIIIITILIVIIIIVYYRLFFGTPCSKLEEPGDVYLMMSLKDADFTGKPSVLLVGQYSTGKTTLIRFQTY